MPVLRINATTDKITSPSMLDGELTLAEGMSLLIIIGTPKKRAVFIESFTEGSTVVNAKMFTSLDNIVKSGFGASIADDRASEWKSISFTDASEALSLLTSLRNDQTMYFAKLYTSSELPAINQFFDICSGWELISTIDDFIQENYRKAFKEPLSYLHTEPSSKRCSLM